MELANQYKFKCEYEGTNCESVLFKYETLQERLSVISNSRCPINNFVFPRCLQKQNIFYVVSFFSRNSFRKDEVHLKVGKCSVVKIYFSCVSMLLVSLVNKNIILPLLITFC